MKLTLDNVGRVSHAEVIVDGVTVLCGYNGSGKSTVSKSLYGALKAYANMDNAVTEERRASLKGAFRAWCGDLSKSIPYDKIPSVLRDCDSSPIVDYIDTCSIQNFSFDRIKGIIEDDTTTLLGEGVICPSNESLESLHKAFNDILARDKGEYESYIASSRLEAIFQGQIGNLNLKDKPSIIRLEDGLASIDIRVEGGNVTHSFCTLGNILEPVYISVTNPIDTSIPGYKIARRSVIPSYRFLMEDPETYSRKHKTLEEARLLEKGKAFIKEYLESITCGRLEKEAGNKPFYYVEDGLDGVIACGNIASGLKNFLVIQRLIANGTLLKGRILIVDEPETNMHPEWQLKFAYVLVALYRELGIKVVVNTHSPYFLRAMENRIETYAEDDEGIYNNVHYYWLEKGEKQFNTSKDVMEDTDVIYETLAAPLRGIV